MKPRYGAALAAGLFAIGAVFVAASVHPSRTGGIGSPSVSVSGLPNSNLTPGAIQIGVTAQALCAPGYTTRSIRPSVSYTDQLKVTQIGQYGYVDTNPRDYEEDHLIALELGGNPTDPQNLWPEPRYGPHPASEKDALENRLHKLVCGGSVALSAAQAAIAGNWITAEALK